MSDLYRVIDQHGNVWRNSRGIGIYESKSGAGVARSYAQKLSDRYGWDRTYRVQSATYAEWENV